MFVFVMAIESDVKPSRLPLVTPTTPLVLITRSLAVITLAFAVLLPLATLPVTVRVISFKPAFSVFTATPLLLVRLIPPVAVTSTVSALVVKVTAPAPPPMTRSLVVKRPVAVMLGDVIVIVLVVPVERALAYDLTLVAPSIVSPLVALSEASISTESPCRRNCWDMLVIGLLIVMMEPDLPTPLYIEFEMMLESRELALVSVPMPVPVKGAVENIRFCTLLVKVL